MTQITHLKKTLYSMALRFRSRLQTLSKSHFIVLVCGCVVLLFGVYGPTLNNSKEKRTIDPLVTIAYPSKDSVDIILDALGTVSPSQSIVIKPQVDGVIKHIHFEEGQFVKKGDMIAEIESDSFKAQLKQYEGQLARDKALLETARLDLNRYETLLKQDSISRQIYETQKSLVKQYEGIVQTDQALVEQARINYDYCFIQAPSEGLIGLKRVDAGNYIRSQDENGLVILNKIDPITATFTLPEEHLPYVLEKHRLTHSPLIVFAYDRSNEKNLGSTGLLRIDNQIDPQTGTIKFKAEFNNKEQKLFPNQFVGIRLKTETLKQALLIPTQSIHYGVEGAYVYCLDPETNRVTRKTIKTGPVKGALTVASNGLTWNDQIIIEGTDKIKEGSAVRVNDSLNQQSDAKTKTARF